MAVNIDIDDSKTFLLLEDMDNLRAKIIADMRSIKINARMLEAESVEKARELIAANTVNLIICDWNLPDGTGFDFLTEIKSDHRFKHIPVIMCTTQDEIVNILNAIKAGADEYITKPWSVEEIEEKIFSTWKKNYL